MSKATKNGSTSVDNYKPTANELKVVEAMCDPDNRDLSVSDICELVGISRNGYYKMFKKPDFSAYYNSMQNEMIKGNLNEIIKATIKFAVSDPKCHGDRKILLEMGGAYTPKQDVNMNLNQKLEDFI